MDKTMDQIRDEVLKLAPVGYEDWYENASSRDIDNAIGYLNGMVQFAARLGGYLEHRQMGGGHKGAVKASNKIVARVRKAMGYAYPRQDLNF